MTFNRHAKQTDANQSEIVEGLRKAGCTVSIIGRPVDLLVGYRGINSLLEVKLPRGPKGGDVSTRTPAQREFYLTWRGSVFEVRSLAQALQVVGVR